LKYFSKELRRCKADHLTGKPKETNDAQKFVHLRVEKRWPSGLPT
jgi:hypothetical protein